MKVTKVLFNHRVALPTGQVVSEMSAEGFPDIPLDYDPQSACIKIGNKHIPLSSVKEFDLEGALARCPECKQDFLDARGLGAHRAHVHKVAGSSRRKEITDER